MFNILLKHPFVHSTLLNYLHPQLFSNLQRKIVIENSRTLHGRVCSQKRTKLPLNSSSTGMCVTTEYFHQLKISEDQHYYVYISPSCAWIRDQAWGICFYHWLVTLNVQIIKRWRALQIPSVYSKAVKWKTMKWRTPTIILGLLEILRHATKIGLYS